MSLRHIYPLMKIKPIKYNFKHQSCKPLLLLLPIGGLKFRVWEGYYEPPFTDGETKVVCISGSMYQYPAEEHKTDEKDLDHRVSGSLCITNFHLLCWLPRDSEAAHSRHITYSHAKTGSLPGPWCATLPKWIFHISQHRTIITATRTELLESQEFPW